MKSLGLEWGASERVRVPHEGDMIVKVLYQHVDALGVELLGVVVHALDR